MTVHRHAQEPGFPLICSSATQRINLHFISVDNFHYLCFTYPFIYSGSEKITGGEGETNAESSKDNK